MRKPLRKMKEQLVTLKTAKLAKEKGFDWKVLFFYTEDKNPVKLHTLEHEEVYFAPSLGVGVMPGWKYNFNLYETIENRDYYGETSDITIVEASAPTQSFLQRWLREVCGIKVTVDTDVTLSWVYSIQSLYPEASYSGDYIVSENIFSTYEEALKEGLLEALKLIKLCEH